MKVMAVSERFACRVTGQNRTTQRREPTGTTVADPGAALRQWLGKYAKDHPRRGFRPAYHDARGEGRSVNHKKLQRLLVPDPSARRDQRLEGGLQPPPTAQLARLPTTSGLRCCLHPPDEDRLSREVDQFPGSGQHRLARRQRESSARVVGPPKPFNMVVYSGLRLTQDHHVEAGHGCRRPSDSWSAKHTVGDQLESA